MKGQIVMGYYITLPTRDEQLVFDGTLQETIDYLAASMGVTGKPEANPCQVRSRRIKRRLHFRIE